MAYTKPQIYNITARLYQELRNPSNDIVLKKLKNIQGEYNFATDTVTLDYRKDFLSTLIHEYLHKWYPLKSETWILQNERMIVNALSTRQIKRIICELAKTF